MARLRNNDFDEFWLKERRALAYPHILQFDVSEEIEVDYLCNYNAVRLCSSRLRDILSQASSPEDNVQWLPAQVITPSGVARFYSVLHFPAQLNVLDEANTVRLGGDVLDPVFDEKLVGARQLLTWNGTLTRWCIDHKVRKSIDDQGLSGMSFSEVRVTFQRNERRF